MLLPVLQVYGSTGHPTLGVTNTYATQPATFSASTSYVSVQAGTATAQTDAAVKGYFAIEFGTYKGAQLVTFSGAQFSLYLSKNGLAEISPGDVLYAGPTLFSVSDLTTNPGWFTIHETNGTFYIGQTTSGAEVITGPLPTKISNEYKYIKIFDGTTTSVAVSAQYVNILPGITISPSSGAAGTSVVVSGGGFSMDTKVNINYTYSITSWGGKTAVKNGTWVSGVNTASLGYFSTTAAMLDVKQVYNPSTGIIASVPITFTAVNATDIKMAFTTGSGDALFTENSRVFNQEYSYLPGGGIAAANPKGTYGNDTAHLDYMTTLPAYVTGSIGIAGNYSVVDSAVTVTLGTTTVTVTSNGASGRWIANITVPTLPKGIQTVYVKNNGVTYNFEITIVPTLVLTPTSGPYGTTVTAVAYGFNPTSTKAPVILYWYEHSLGDDTFFWLVNATVSITGTFNNTGGVHFTVPLTFGGQHYVYASTVCVTVGECKAGGSTGSIPGPDQESFAIFTVTPTLVICNGSTCGSGATAATTITVSSNSRIILKMEGQGFAPYWIFVNIDNAQYSDCDTYISGTGNTTLGFSVAGFSPGLHQVDTYACDEYPYEYQTGVPLAVAYFNVTGISSSSSSGIPTSVINTINNINTNVQTIMTDLNTVSANVNTILAWGPTITSTNGNVATILGWGPMIKDINSTVSGLQTSLKSLTSSIGTISTDLGTTSLAAVLQAATAAQGAANSASSAASSAQSSVSSTETYVLVVAVLVAITLVLELAVLIRKLD